MKQLTRKTISVLLSLLMLLSVFGGMAVLANAEGGETYTYVKEKPATCTEDGYYGHYEDAEQNCYIREENGGFKPIDRSEIIEPGGHDFVHYSAKEPDCTDGNPEYWFCRRCKGYYKDGNGNEQFENPNETVLAATAEHNYQLVDEESIQASCTGKGYLVYRCTVCGAEKKETVPMLSHHDSDGNGECDDCGYAYQTPGACRLCNKVHTGFFGKIVKFFHEAFWIINKALQ